MLKKKNDRRFLNCYQTIWLVAAQYVRWRRGSRSISDEKSNFSLVEYVDISRSLPNYWPAAVVPARAAAQLLAEFLPKSQAVATAGANFIQE